MFFAFDALSEFTVAEKGLVVSTMKVIEDKTGCVQFRKVQTSLGDRKNLIEDLQGSRREWSVGLGVDHHTARKRVNARKT